nr:LicD family protein [Lachnospiraceae bacterium]
MKDQLTKKEIQNELFSMLCVFDDYCTQHDLKYFLIGGTLLGAVRHKGFIPWDDDIDVGMPRDDYERFLDLVRSEPVAENLYVISSREGDFDLPFSELLNKEIVLERPKMEFLDEKDRVKNLFLDVIPIDGFPDSRLMSSVLMTTMDMLRNLTTASKAKMFHGTTFARAVLKTPKVMFARIIGRARLVRIMEKIALRSPYSECRYMGVVTNGLYGVGERYEKAKAFPETKVSFEGRLFPAPACYDEYLTGIYGDYMKLPPKSEQKDRHVVTARRIGLKKDLSNAEIKQALLYMLKKFDDLCTRLDVRYSLAGGSLLGAVRHKGFIPWDDDIDVGIPRPDYERFCRITRNRTLDNGHIHFISEHDPKWPLPIAKMYDDRIAVDFEYKKEDAHDGLWIDILPVDGMPEKQSTLKWHFKKLDFYRTMLYMSIADPNKGTTGFRRLVKKIMQPVFCVLSWKVWKKLILFESKRYDFDKSSHVGIAASGLYGPGESVTKNTECKEMDFEDMKVRGTVMWEEY